MINKFTIFGSKLRNNEGLFFLIVLMEDQSNMGDGGRCGLLT